MIFILNIYITSVSDVNRSEIYVVLRVKGWSNFRDEPSQAARSIIFSSLVDSSFSRVVERCSNDNDVSMFSLFDQSVQARIVIYHCEVRYYKIGYWF